MARGISGGQAKRVNIGIALVTNPRVLFLGGFGAHLLMVVPAISYGKPFLGAFGLLLRWRLIAAGGTCMLRMPTECLHDAPRCCSCTC